MAQVRAENIIPEFSQADFQEMVLHYNRPDLKYRDFFPLRFNPTLNFGNIERDTDANVMASVVAFGSRSPRASREFASTYKGKIPKVQLARDLDEEDMFNLRELRDGVTRQINILREFPTYNADGTVSLATQRQIASLGGTLAQEIYADPVFLRNSIDNRLEWMAKQIASTGLISLTVASNAKGVHKLDIDFKVTKENPSADWASGSSDPIKDIKRLRKQARAKGYNFNVMVTDGATLDLILSHDKIKEFVYGVVTNQNNQVALVEPTLDQLNARLQVSGLPVIRTWDSSQVEENKKGVKVEAEGWRSGYILLSDTTELGDTRYTQNDDFFMNVDGSVVTKQVVDNMILVQQYGQTDPMILSSMAKAYAIPVMNNIKRKVILKAFASVS